MTLYYENNIIYIYVSEYVRPSLKKYWFTLYDVDRYM